MDIIGAAALIAVGIVVAAVLYARVHPTARSNGSDTGGRAARETELAERASALARRSGPEGASGGACGRRPGPVAGGGGGALGREVQEGGGRAAALAGVDAGAGGESTAAVRARSRRRPAHSLQS